MKKLLTVLAALMMVLSLAACSSKEPAAPVATADEEVYNVGVIQLVEHVALDAATKGFVDVLNEKLGDKVNVEVKNAQGQGEVCTTIANDFVSNEFDLIMGNATPALLAARTATDTIPVLGTSVTDYASALELTLNDMATGINVSGTSDGVPAQAYVDCLLECVPEAQKVVVVYCSGEPNSVKQADDFVAAMAETKPEVEVTVATFNDSNDMQSVVTAAVEGVDAMYIPTDNTAASNMTIIKNVCEPIGLPIVCGEEGMCKSGGTVTVSISYYNIGRVCGEMAYDILVNGADVSTMAIGYDNAPVKKYNAENVTAINFTVPEGYEAIAD